MELGEVDSTNAFTAALLDNTSCRGQWYWHNIKPPEKGQQGSIWAAEAVKISQPSRDHSTRISLRHGRFSCSTNL
ncbi:MAG: hypothetical protein IPP17_19370 [Bacteroidetes bacterium]|nr:hypothetical protein [Bacteroidota bacterium]